MITEYVWYNPTTDRIFTYFSGQPDKHTDAAGAIYLGTLDGEPKMEVTRHVWFEPIDWLDKDEKLGRFDVSLIGDKAQLGPFEQDYIYLGEL